MARQESRFGFGQFAGSVGAIVIAVSVSQPWVRLDLAAAFREALTRSGLSQRAANDILYAGSQGSMDQLATSPVVGQVARALGVEESGLAQDLVPSIVVLVLAFVALVAVVRSVLASTAWEARANAPFLAVAGFGALIVAAVEFWLRSPQPRAAIRPDLGLWMLVAGGVLLLLGGLTLGSNRRRPFLDDFAQRPTGKAFEATEHLAYSHGAWVPRSSAESER